MWVKRREGNFPTGCMLFAWSERNFDTPVGIVRPRFKIRRTIRQMLIQAFLVERRVKRMDFLPPLAFALGDVGYSPHKSRKVPDPGIGVA